MAVKDIRLGSGYIDVYYEGGEIKRKQIITALGGTYDPDEPTVVVPDLTIESLPLLTTLAQLIWVLVRSLEEQGVISEELMDGFDLEYILNTLSTDLEVEEV